MNSLELPGEPKDNRVVVAMSGGVDSSVAAALLHREGYEVIGITLQLYSDNTGTTGRTGSCCGNIDAMDARKVSEKLGFPHYVINYEERFHSEVIRPFTESYVSGETPVPCISCNQKIKFVDLLEMSRELGADALVTGHYIRSRMNGTRRTLHRSVDLDRDQSYFLFTMTQEQIDYIRFPLGGMHKADVRILAHEMELPVATKADSQDICFVSQGRYSEIVARLQPNAEAPGDIIHIDGRKMGRHQGIFRYTVGQRRGLGLHSSDPLYVIQIDPEKACIFVGPQEALKTFCVHLKDVNWLGNEPLEKISSLGVEVFVKIRSAHLPCKARVYTKGGVIRIEFVGEAIGAAPGQACVFYSDDSEDACILGGGFITRSEINSAIKGAC